jgi:hypothetical protein
MNTLIDLFFFFAVMLLSPMMSAYLPQWTMSGYAFQ